MGDQATAMDEEVQPEGMILLAFSTETKMLLKATVNILPLDVYRARAFIQDIPGCASGHSISATLCFWEGE